MLWFDQREYALECAALGIIHPRTRAEVVPMAQVWQWLWDCQDLGVEEGAWATYILSLARSGGSSWASSPRAEGWVEAVCRNFARWLRVEGGRMRL